MTRFLARLGLYRCTRCNGHYHPTYTGYGDPVLWCTRCGHQTADRKQGRRFHGVSDTQEGQ